MSRDKSVPGTDGGFAFYPAKISTARVPFTVMASHGPTTIPTHKADTEASTFFISACTTICIRGGMLGMYPERPKVWMFR